MTRQDSLQRIRAIAKSTGYLKSIVYINDIYIYIYIYILYIYILWIDISIFYIIYNTSRENMSRSGAFCKHRLGHTHQNGTFLKGNKLLMCHS